MKTSNNVKNNPLTTIVGLLFIAAGFAFMFVETLQEIPLYVIIGCWVGGVLLLFAKDKLVDLLTLGISNLLRGNPKIGAGGIQNPDPDKDDDKK